MDELVEIYRINTQRIYFYQFVSKTFQCGLSMTRIRWAVFLFSFRWLLSDAQNCEKNSITTASGSKALKGPFCSGQLIFEDNFDKLDTDVWQHEVQFSHVNNLLSLPFRDSLEIYFIAEWRISGLCVRNCYIAFLSVIIVMIFNFSNNRSNSFIQDGKLCIRPTCNYK